MKDFFTGFHMKAGLILILVVLCTLPALAQDEIAELRGRADEGNLDAQIELAEWYSSSDRHSDAFPYWLLAARQGDEGSMLRVGDFYRTGLHIPGDLVQARYWYEQIIHLDNAVQMLLWIDSEQYPPDHEGWAPLATDSAGNAFYWNRESLYRYSIGQSPHVKVMVQTEYAEPQSMEIEGPPGYIVEVPHDREVEGVVVNCAANESIVKLMVLLEGAMRNYRTTYEEHEYLGFDTERMEEITQSFREIKPGTFRDLLKQEVCK